MGKNGNPILNFRASAMRSKSSDDCKYDIKIGGRINGNGRMQIEVENKPLATLITETREAVDNSENS